MVKSNKSFSESDEEEFEEGEARQSSQEYVSEKDHSKFPLCLEVKVSRPSAQEISDWVGLEKLAERLNYALPNNLFMRIYLIPSVDVLTVDIDFGKQVHVSTLNVDSLLGGLFDKSSMGILGLM